MTTPVHLFKTARRQLRKLRHRGTRTEQEAKLIESADRQRAEGLGFRYDGFGENTTQALLSKLAELGIAHDERSFREEALAAGTPTALSERWLARTTAQGKWRDHPLLASRELWRRLLPEVRSAEVTSDEVDALLEEAEVSAQKQPLWHRAAQLLIAQCAGADGALDRDFFAQVKKESGSDLESWLIELPAALMGSAFAQDAPELALALSNLVDRAAMLAERAELLARLGRQGEARAEIEALAAEYPETPVVLLKAGGVFELLGDLAKAQLYLGRYAVKMQGPGSAEARAQASRAKVALPPVERPAPNQKCPCGSGKKYKHCHALPS